MSGSASTTGSHHGQASSSSPRLWRGGWKNGVGMLLWGGFLRHARPSRHWLVNSATHLWAAGALKPAMIPQQLVVALFSGGEGWHKPTPPVSARQALPGTNSIPMVGIWLLSKVGLAQDPGGK